MLPNFIVIGAAKAGTTALYWYLDEHPDVFMSPVKETNYFAYGVDERGNLPRQLLRRVWHARVDDRHLLFERRVLDPLIQAAAFQRVVDFARAVGRENDERRLRRA